MKHIAITVVIVMKTFIMMTKNIHVVMVRLMTNVMHVMRDIDVMMTASAISIVIAMTIMIKRTILATFAYMMTVVAMGKIIFRKMTHNIVDHNIDKMRENHM